MTQQSTEEITIQLEESLGICTLESGPRLLEAVIADKMPNHGAIKNILKAPWKSLGKPKFPGLETISLP